MVTSSLGALEPQPKGWGEWEVEFSHGLGSSYDSDTFPLVQKPSQKNKILRIWYEEDVQRKTLD